MSRNKKILLFWGLVKLENVDLEKEKSIKTIIILIIILYFIIRVLMLLID